MGISSVNTTASLVGAAQPTSTSGAAKTVNDVKRPAPSQPHPEESDTTPQKVYSRIDKTLTNMGFLLDKGLSDHMVTVIKNKKTGETIRLVPSEEQLKIKKAMSDSTGNLLDQIV